MKVRRVLESLRIEDNMESINPFESMNELMNDDHGHSKSHMIIHSFWDINFLK